MQMKIQYYILLLFVITEHTKSQQQLQKKSKGCNKITFIIYALLYRRFTGKKK